MIHFSLRTEIGQFQMQVSGTQLLRRSLIDNANDEVEWLGVEEATDKEYKRLPDRPEEAEFS